MQSWILSTPCSSRLSVIASYVCPAKSSNTGTIGRRAGAVGQDPARSLNNGNTQFFEVAAGQIHDKRYRNALARGRKANVKALRQALSFLASA